MHVIEKNSPVWNLYNKTLLVFYTCMHLMQLGNNTLFPVAVLDRMVRISLCVFYKIFSYSFYN